jgi:hypothetical protein
MLTQLQSRLAFVILVATSLTISGPTMANSCQWWSPYNGNTYTNVTVQQNGGASLSPPVVVLDFWGSWWNTHAQEQNTIVAKAQTMFASNLFWGRYAQYGLTTGSLFATIYDGARTVSNISLSRQGVEQQITSDVTNFGMPSLNANTITLIYLAPDITTQFAGAGPVGFHSSFNNTAGKEIVYAIVNNVGTTNAGIALATVMMGHEVMEASTNPNQRSADGGGGGNGYFATLSNPGTSPGQQEIGDLCSALPVVLSGVMTQKSWFQDLCSCGRFGSYQQWWGNTFSGSGGNFLDDVTGDGKADLVGAGWGYVGVLPSTGSAFGTYQTWWNSSFYGSHGTLLGDITGDHKADLIALRDDHVGVLVSNGSGFDNHENWPGGIVFYGSHGTLVGDIDNNGKEDLVGLGDGYVGVLRTNDSGTGFNAYEQWWGNSFYGMYNTLLGDIDADGKADLVGLGNGYIGVIRSNGSGFGAYETWYGNPPSWVNGGAPFGANAATFLKDVDGDGCADLVADNGETIVVLHSLYCMPIIQNATVLGPSKTAQFGAPEMWWNGPFNGSHGNLMGDVTGDGYPDLVGLGNGFIGELTAYGL